MFHSTMKTQNRVGIICQKSSEPYRIFQSLWLSSFGNVWLIELFQLHKGNLMCVGVGISYFLSQL